MSDQKLPQKMKKKNNKLKEEDKEKCNNYYSEVYKFIEKNDVAVSKKIKEINYFFEYDKENNYFISNHFDHQNLESYGYYNKKEKKIYLSEEEAFYLNQIGYITFKDGFDFNILNLVKLNLYSYLRRSSKIVLISKILLVKENSKNKNEKKLINNSDIQDIDKYFVLFDNLDDFKNHKIKSILYQHDSDEILNFILFKKVIIGSEKIYDIFKNVNNIKDNSNNNIPEIIICVTQGISIIFLKIDDKIEI